MENINYKKICDAVRADLRAQNISIGGAADLLGISRGSMSNHLNGKMPFTPDLAKRMATTFGYDKMFLLFGEGTLIPRISRISDRDRRKAIEQLRTLVDEELSLLKSTRELLEVVSM